MDAILELVSTISDAWKEQKVATGLFLDVKGAFPSVDLPTLYSELCSRGIPAEYIDWLKVRMAARTTVLTFDDYWSMLFQIFGGLDQGDPLSALLYLFYNSPLLEMAKSSRREFSFGYVDDVTFLTVGKTFDTTHRKLENLLSRPGGILEWAEKHNCEFSISRFQVVDFTRKLGPVSETAPQEGTPNSGQESATPHEGNINGSTVRQATITTFFSTIPHTRTRAVATPQEGQTIVAAATTRQSTITNYFNHPMHPISQPPTSTPQAARKPSKQTVRGQPLRIGNHTVPPASSAKLLGVHIDSKLRWNEQFAACLGKAEGWLRQFRRLTMTTRGLSGQNMARLWMQTAIPRIFYAGEAFIAPSQSVKGSRGGRVRAVTKKALTKLASTQRRGALLITGGLFSSAGDTLDFHAGLIPARLLVARIRHRAAMRIATLPEGHPLHARLHRMRRRKQAKTFKSPVDDLVAEFKVDKIRMETTAAIRRPPYWEFSGTCRIARTEEEAIEEEEHDNADLKIYSDGSGLEKVIGASAVLFRDGVERRSRRFRLGKDDSHEVYDGEGVGILSGLSIARIEGREIQRVLRSISVYVDNQAAIRALEIRHPGPSHYIWDAIDQELGLLIAEHPGVQVTFRWIPAHKDIHGNERADQEAKRATSGHHDTPDDTFPPLLRHSLPKNKTSLRKMHQKKLKQEWQQEWRESPRYKRMAIFDDETSHTKYQDTIDGFPKIHSSILFQLRTGHIALNNHLHRIQKADSPHCPRCHRRETVIHYLLYCPRYDKQRRRLSRAVSSSNMTLHALLSTREFIPALMQYVADTKRLQSSFPNIPPLELDDSDEEGG